MNDNLKKHLDEQDELLRNQDYQLELLGKGVENLRVVASNIGKELDKQEQDIENLQNTISGAQVSLLRGSRKLDKFASKNKCFPCDIL